MKTWEKYRVAIDQLFREGRRSREILEGMGQVFHQELGITPFNYRSVIQSIGIKVIDAKGSAWGVLALVRRNEAGVIDQGYFNTLVSVGHVLFSPTGKPHRQVLPHDVSSSSPKDRRAYRFATAAALPLYELRERFYAPSSLEDASLNRLSRIYGVPVHMIKDRVVKNQDVFFSRAYRQPDFIDHALGFFDRVVVDRIL